MKTALSYLQKQSPVALAVGAGVVIFVVYYVGRDLVKTAVDVGAGVISGNNAITQNQTNASGERVTAYEGAGILGTAGAIANSASGGVLSSVGETLGGWAFDIFGPKTPN